MSCFASRANARLPTSRASLRCRFAVHLGCSEPSVLRCRLEQATLPTGRPVG